MTSHEYLDGHVPAFRDAPALKSKGDDMEIDLREPVQLGQSTQWIRIRAANTRNPLLLLVQLGPGLPMINEVQAFRFTRMRGVL
jgi:hypothetical protein